MSVTNILFKTSLTGGNRGNGDEILGKRTSGRGSPWSGHASTNITSLQIDSKVNLCLLCSLLFNCFSESFEPLTPVV
jgi:hypothetical protein